jgi:hypothetical protein
VLKKLATCKVAEKIGSGQGEEASWHPIASTTYEAELRPRQASGEPTLEDVVQAAMKQLGGG